MRKRIAVLCLAAVCLSGATRLVKPANYDAFGIELLQQLAPQAKDENVFISPLSIGMALSMAADGAQGATRKAIVHALGVPDAGLAESNTALMAALAENTDAKVAVANAIWLRQDIPPRTTYLDLLARDYHAQAQALRFGDPLAATAINNWTKQHTLGLIDRLVAETSKSDFAYLTNALAFMGDWALPFKKQETHPRPFTNADGTKPDVPMMSQTAFFQMLDGKNYSALRMAYGKGGYAAYIILPSPGNNVADLVRSMSATTFDRMAQGMASQRVAVVIPRFTAKYDTSLMAVLKALGMGIAFTDQADFSPIHTPPPGLTISDVHHAAYVRVDEKGTTAAAATSIGFSMTAVQAPPRQFIVDRPFVLALRDERTGALLFIGVINRIST